MQRVAVGAAALMFGTLGAAPAFANTISNFTTVLGTDFATAGIGMRGTGSGSLTISGVSGTPGTSYLFWHGPTNSSSATANANVQVNGTAVTGTNIGFSDDNFWNFDNSQAYRANTSGVIGANGSYALSGFRTPPNVEINGAGAAVFFNDGNTANDRDIVIFNGNDSNFSSPFDTAGWDLSLNGINYVSGSVSVTLFVSDGQNFGLDDDGTLRINGTPIASGGLFQGDTLTGPSVGNGNLFDIKTFDITSLLTPGINNLNLTLDEGFSDALSIIAAFIDLPAGAAPPPPPVPAPAALALFGLGLTGLLAVRGRRVSV